MAQYQNLPVFKDAYDLLLRVFSVGRTLPREFRYTIGEDLKKTLLAMLLGIFRANRSRDKRRDVTACREHIETVKIYVRILHDLKQLPLKQYVMLAERCESVSKQLAAWDKYLARTAAAAADAASGRDAAGFPGSPKS